MPVSRGRKRKGQSHKGHRPRRAPEQSPAVLAMAGLAEIDEPAGQLYADLLLSELLGVPYTSLEWDQADAIDSLGENLLAEAETSTRPGALALLAALASVGPESVTERAAAMLDVRRQSEPDLLVPSWADLSATLTCTGTYRATQVYGDLTQYVAEFHYGSGVEGSHLVLWLIDANLGGSADDILVLEDAGASMAKLHAFIADEASHMLPMEAVDEAELHARVRAAMDLETVTAGSPEEESYADYRALALARLRLLAAPLELPDDEVTMEAREALVEDFVGSPEAHTLMTRPPDGSAADPLEEDVLRTVAGLAVDFASDRGGGDPMRISPTSVTILLLDWAPRSVLVDPEDVAAMPRVLSAWATYACRVRDRGSPAPIHEAIAEVTDDFLELMSSGDRRSVGTQILAELLAEGVDLTDPEQLAAGIERYTTGLDSG